MLSAGDDQVFVIKHTFGVTLPDLADPLIVRSLSILTDIDNVENIVISSDVA